MFATLPHERDGFCHALWDVQAECGSSRALSILTLVVFAYMTNKAQPGTGLERELIQKVAEVEYHLPPLGAFSSYVLVVQLTVRRILGWCSVVKVVVLCRTFC